MTVNLFGLSDFEEYGVGGNSGCFVDGERKDLGV